MCGNESLIDQLRAMETEALGAIAEASGEEALETLRIRYLGRKDGRISGVLRGLKSLDPAERPRVGAEANRVRDAVESAWAENRRGHFAVSM